MPAHCKINFAFFSTPLYVQKVATPPPHYQKPGIARIKLAKSGYPPSRISKKGLPPLTPDPPKWLPLNLNPPPKRATPHPPQYQKGLPINPPQFKNRLPPPDIKKGYPPRCHGIDLRKSGHPPTTRPNKAQKSPSFEGLSDKGATPSTSRLGNVWG